MLPVLVHFLFCASDANFDGLRVIFAGYKSTAQQTATGGRSAERRPTLSELNMFQSIFVSFNADFEHCFDVILVKILGNELCRSGIVVLDVFVPHKDTVKIVFVAPPFWLSTSVLHVTESPEFLPLTSTLQNMLLGGANFIAVPANFVHVIAVTGRTFGVVVEAALVQQFFIPMLLASDAGNPFFSTFLIPYAALPKSLSTTPHHQQFRVHRYFYFRYLFPRLLPT